MTDALSQAARRFPLVARARPACPPLDERVREIGELARAAAGQTGDAALPLAATVHNKAALIASDCGLPDLARSLCWQQFEVYMRARPLGAPSAQYALEPIVNLARLLIRSGEGEGAYRLLDTPYQAVASRTEAVIDGREISFRDFTSSDADHRMLCQWLWAVLLADGTRALVSAGRWDQALTHAEQHRGVGQRLLDGRQVAVLARYGAGDLAAALALVRESTTAEPWEQLVAACLTVLCLRADDRPADTAAAAMTEQYLKLAPGTGLVVFHVRLGLAVLDLASGVEQPGAARTATRLLEEAVAAEDGYAARDVLAHDRCKAMFTGDRERLLIAAVQSSGLQNSGSGMPEIGVFPSLAEQSYDDQFSGCGAGEGWQPPDRLPHAMPIQRDSELARRILTTSIRVKYRSTRNINPHDGHIEGGTHQTGRITHVQGPAEHRFE